MSRVRLVSGLVAVVAVAAIAPAGSGRGADPAASAESGPVVVVLTIGRDGRGSFTAAGTLADRGVASARRVRGGRRARVTLTLAGAEGSLRLVAESRCGKRAAVWRVVGGEGAYEGATGRGTGRTTDACARTRALRAVYSGTIAVPDVPPVVFGGRTSQRKPVDFEVDQRRRVLTKLAVGVDASCANGSRASTSLRLDTPVSLRSDGTFVVELPLGRISGTVAGTTATGTAAYDTGEPWRCRSGETTWSARSPPPAAVPGRYCGFTVQGKSACLDVDTTGRRAAFTTTLAVTRCSGAATFDVTTTVQDVEIGSHLGAYETGVAAFTGGGQARYWLELAFSDDGSVTGSFTFDNSTIVDGGVTYTCQRVHAQWTARRT